MLYFPNHVLSASLVALKWEKISGFYFFVKLQSMYAILPNMFPMIRVWSLMIERMQRVFWVLLPQVSRDRFGKRVLAGVRKTICSKKNSMHQDYRGCEKRPLPLIRTTRKWKRDSNIMSGKAIFVLGLTMKRYSVFKTAGFLNPILTAWLLREISINFRHWVKKTSNT